MNVICSLFKVVGKNSADSQKLSNILMPRTYSDAYNVRISVQLLSLGFTFSFIHRCYWHQIHRDLHA